MTKEEFRVNVLDMLYLAQCAVNQKTPDKTRIDALNLEQLYEAAKKHSMTAVTAIGLEAAGIRDPHFTAAKEKALRKNILLDAERKRILQKLEEAEIWYMPLKGAILKEYYPKSAMRQMSDNDILCDSTCREKIHDIMLSLGFTSEHFGISCDDAYFKKPVSNFEMHSALFAIEEVQGLENFCHYYSNVKERLLKDEDNQYGWHFSNEDFYLYVTAHEYKHYASSGTGVRTLLDTYVFMKKFHDVIDWHYLHEELKKLGIFAYEKQSRHLAEKIFTEQPLTAQEQNMLDYYIFSETYGNPANRAANRFQNFAQQSGSTSPGQYIFQRIFPSMEFVKAWYPFFYQHKILLPVLWFIVRPFRALTVHKKDVAEEVRQLKNQTGKNS